MGEERDNSVCVDGDKTPHLIYFDLYSRLFKLYNPTLDSSSSLSFPEIWGDDVIDGIYYYYAKSGWMLLGVDKSSSYSYFLFNPSTKNTIHLPNPEKPSPFGPGLMSFSNPPTSPDCMIVYMTFSREGHVECILTLKLGEDSWTIVLDIENNQDFVVSHYYNMLYSGATDAFYVLGRDGTLGKICVQSEGSRYHWEVIDMPRQEERFKNFHYMFLLENDGDLMCVAASYDGSRVSVMKLDRRQMIWQDVDNLDGQVLYLSKKTSVARKATLPGTDNKIYFLMKYNDTGLFYCLATKMLCNSSRTFCRKDNNGTTELLHCIWTEAP